MIRTVVVPLNDPEASPIAIGKRVRMLRKMTGLPRKAFAVRHSISVNTLQNWEDGRSRLKEKGAKRLVLALREDGILCSLKWLLLGKGNLPYITQKIYYNQETSLAIEETIADYVDEEMQIINEISNLQQYYRDIIDLVVKDEGMAPYFMIEDYVAGKRLYNQDIERAIGLNCIVETVTGELYLRNLKAGEKRNTYNLLCLNLNTTLKEPLIYGAELISAAPVIWQRRKSLTFSAS